MFKKLMSLGLVLVMTLAMGMTAFSATTVSTAEANRILDDIVEYSTYNYQTKSWDLDYAIVDDGALTETQYNDAEVVGNHYKELFSNDNPPQTRSLSAAVVLILKAIAAAGGAAAAVEIAQDIYKYGITVACQNFTGIEMFNDFCEINGYI